ncbi:hypothetical protein [Thalassobacillus hwangdonensis]|uniref:Uncharacterized protein n=1 Tax=Thalassobacillus hwangdonensis TaxID=546108 RepID=A0ABW3KYJ9_9BACI
MAYFIQPCFHWIGFHLVEYLLKNGQEVIGVDPIDSDKEEFKYLWIGRNSNFQHFRTRLGMEKHCDTEHIEREFVIDNEKGTITMEVSNIKRQEKKEEYVLPVPHLYGEWMPRDEETLNMNGERISVEDYIKREDTVYIEDFVHQLLRWKDSDSRNEEPSFISDNHKSDDQMVKRLNEHYMKYRIYYES